MGDLIGALITVTIALGGLLGLLGGLYWLSGKLPKKWQEGTRSWVFLFPAMVAMIVGLLIPAIRTEPVECSPASSAARSTWASSSSGSPLRLISQ